MAVTLYQEGYDDNYFEVIGQLVFDTSALSSDGVMHSIIGNLVVADLNADLDITPNNFFGIRWRFDCRHDLTNYNGSYYKSALPKADLGSLCICSSGSVVEEIFLNYAVQGTRVYQTWDTYPAKPYPNDDLVATGSDGVQYIPLQTSQPTANIGDEFYAKFRYPNLLQQVVVNYTALGSVDTPDTVGITNFWILA